MSAFQGWTETGERGKTVWHRTLNGWPQAVVVSDDGVALVEGHGMFIESDSTSLELFKTGDRVYNRVIRWDRGVHNRVKETVEEKLAAKPPVFHDARTEVSGAVSE